MGSDTNMAPPDVCLTDMEGQSWRISLRSDHILLEKDAVHLRIPAARWRQDIFIMRDDTAIVLRFETFDCAVGFKVDPETAGPLLKHFAEIPLGFRSPISSQERHEDRLIWPKVSPLAVWALICAALAFVPVMGVVSTISSVILLIRHRLRVPKSDAWRHSRTLCKAAVAFLVIGIPVNVAGSYNFYHRMLKRQAALNVLNDAQGNDRLPRIALITETVDISEGQSHRRMVTQAQDEAESETGGRHWGIVAASLIILLLSLTVHEAAHAITAWWLGDDLARRIGRVTLNPLAHIDPLGTVVLPLFLYMANAPMFGWAKSVPVRTESLQRPRRGDILISLAGPGSNLLLASAALMLQLAIGCAVGFLAPSGTIKHFSDLDFGAPIAADGFTLAPLVGPACTVLMLCFVINAFLAFLNLIPIPPLDGSWVLEKMFPRAFGPVYARIRPFGFLIIVILLYSDTFEYLIMPAMFALVPGIIMLSSCTPF